jgi:hypothetical protein
LRSTILVPTSSVNPAVHVLFCCAVRPFVEAITTGHDDVDVAYVGVADVGVAGVGGGEGGGGDGGGGDGGGGDGGMHQQVAS